MRKSFAASMIVVILAGGMPLSSLAQSNLDECITAFESQVDAWDTDQSNNDVALDCEMTTYQPDDRSAVIQRRVAASAAEGTKRYFVSATLIRDKKDVECRVYRAHHRDEVFNESWLLSNAEAAALNIYLMFDGCEYAANAAYGELD